MHQEVHFSISIKRDHNYNHYLNGRPKAASYYQYIVHKELKVQKEQSKAIERGKRIKRTKQ